jgi:nicotinate-nucleotide pyrophosphorylase (carboxylating)
LLCTLLFPVILLKTKILSDQNAMPDFSASDWEQIDPLLRAALAEDLGGSSLEGDVTTRAVLGNSPEPVLRAKLISKAQGVIAGVAIVRRLVRFVGGKLSFQVNLDDGSKCLPGDVILTMKGPATQLLALERTGLNFLQRLSGIATLTARFVEAVRPYPVQILDTRKTTPNLRHLEKWAVRIGGGVNHRFGLFDMVLVKENHIALFKRSRKEANLAEMVRQIREKTPDKKIMVEVVSLDQVKELLSVPPDYVMLDNFSVERAREAVEFLKQLPEKPFETEISGGITLANVREMAATGVDRISIGALTHSAPALDMSLLVEE